MVYLLSLYLNFHSEFSTLTQSFSHSYIIPPLTNTFSLVHGWLPTLFSREAIIWEEKMQVDLPWRHSWGSCLIFQMYKKNKSPFIIIPHKFLKLLYILMLSFLYQFEKLNLTTLSYRCAFSFKLLFWKIIHSRKKRKWTIFLNIYIELEYSSTPMLFSLYK